MSAPSVRAATLAFALSSWFEGLTQLRTVLLIPYVPGDSPEDGRETPPAPDGTWKDRALAWLTRKGREMDDIERATLGILDVTTAFTMLQLLRQPLLPFLLSPLLPTLPLPRSTSGFKPTKWPYVFLSTVLLSLLHEAERVSVALAVDCAKKRRETRNRELLGEVYVRGDDVRPCEDDEDEEAEECLICAGVGPDTSLSQSISSLSSIATGSAPIDALGPLEAFCVTAPQKHVAHRSCFLSWHAAYRQQRLHLSPEHVELVNMVASEATRKRARAILDAAGFTHLSRYIRFPYELPWTRSYPPPSEPQPLIRPTFTLTDDAAGSSSSKGSSSRPLATLHTTTPPCPGCRGSVLLHFFSRPAPASRDQARPNTRREALKVLTRLWIYHWSKLVTGRTLLYRMASQWSFVMALLSMIRVSGGTVRWTYV